MPLQGNLIRQPLARPKRFVRIAHDDGRSCVVDIKLGLCHRFMVPCARVGKDRPDRRIPFAAGVCPFDPLRAFGGIARGHHLIGHGNSAAAFFNCAGSGPHAPMSHQYAPM